MPRLPRIRRACAIASVVLAVALALGATIVALVEQGLVADAQREAASRAARQASALQDQLYRALSATDALAAVLRQTHGDVSSFEAMARDLLPFHPGVSALQLAPGGVVRASVPLAGNEAAIGHDLLADPGRNHEAIVAVQTRRLTLAGPFRLIQGGVAVVGRNPVFLPGSPQTFWGFATAILRIDDLIRASRLAELEAAGYAYELGKLRSDGGGAERFAGTAGARPDAPVVHAFDVPNGRWVLSVAPSGGWTAQRTLAIEIALVVLCSFAAAVVAYGLARRPERLEAVVADRTREIREALLALQSLNERLGREIAEHRRTQASLAESEERLRTLLEATSDWVWEVDERGVYTYASPKVKDLLGYEAVEVLGRTPFDFMDADEAARVGIEFAAIAAQRRPFSMLVNTNRHKLGHEVVLETSGVPHFDDTGRYRGYRGIDRDVTQRVAAEQRIRKLSRAVEQAANAVMITDVRGVIEYVNPKFCEITGYAPDEVLGRNPRFLKSGEQAPEVYAEMWNALAQGRSWFGEFHNRRRNGELFWCLQSVSAVRSERGEVTHFVSVMEDVSSRKLAESTIRRLAYYDGLTELPNRRLFMDRLAQAIGALGPGSSLALVYLDIDRMNNVNDSLGRAAGDALLRAVAARLVEVVRRDDTVARLEGDEFAVVVPDVGDAGDVARLVEQLMSALRKPFALPGQEIFASASVGVSLYPQDASDIEQLVLCADTALNLAKRDGDAFRLFTSDMNARVAEYLTLETRLRRAIERDEFYLELQPRIDVGADRIESAEALVRWRHPELGGVAPAQFIPLAEETGLIVPIGDWVLRESCRIAARRRAAGHPLRVAVNLSARQLRQGEALVEQVGATLAATGCAASSLEIEITESALIADPEQAARTLRALAALGIRLAIDDFGTGYSSLAYLKHLPVHTLKIDASFVRNIDSAPEDVAIVTAILAIARALGLSVVAEGVETDAQLACLRRLGCREVQGFLLGRPEDPERLFAAIDRAALPAFGV